MSSQDAPVNNSTRGKLFVISAPSGAGKTSVLQAVCAKDNTLKRAVTTTTRPPRDGEVDGQDYHFITHEDFHEKTKAGGFLESATVFGNFYGLTRDAVEKCLRDGENVLVILDVQGAKSVMALMPNDVISIFILPPSPEELHRRLFARDADNACKNYEKLGGDSPKDLKRRLDTAAWEIGFCHSFKYIVVNDDFDEAVADILAITESEKSSKHSPVASSTARANHLLQNQKHIVKTIAFSFMRSQ